MNKTIFLTGATGFVGANLVPRLLQEDPGNRLILLVRGHSDQEAVSRVRKVLTFVSANSWWEKERGRIQVVRGDICDGSLGLARCQYASLAAQVTHIIHAAANVKFSATIGASRAINVDGTKNVVAFAHHARRLGALQRFAYVSTAYVSGLRKGLIYEDNLVRPVRFANPYEQAKHEAETYVRSQGRHLPISIFRPSIIVGDSTTGKTVAFNVIYPPLKLILRRVLPLVPGRRSVRIDMVPIDYVCDALCQIFLRTEDIAGRTYHLTAGIRHAPTAGDVVRSAVTVFNRTAGTTPLSAPAFVPLRIFRALRQFTGRQTRRITKIMDFFLPYVSMSRNFDDTNTRTALAGTFIRVPDFGSYAEPILRFWIESMRKETAPEQL